jgi:hypothetical protein
MKMRWRIALLISVAIAISYLDRQTLPVAIKAIERDIPVSNQQFSLLQTAFLITYGLMYAGGERMLSVPSPDWSDAPVLSAESCSARSWAICSTMALVGASSSPWLDHSTSSASSSFVWRFLRSDQC